MTFYTTIHGPEGMNPDEFGDSVHIHLCVPAGWVCHLAHKIYLKYKFLKHRFRLASAVLCIAKHAKDNSRDRVIVFVC